MAASLTEVNNYISYIRNGIADFVESVQNKEQLGHRNLFCERQKVMLTSAYLDCIVDYFDTFVTSEGVIAYDENNFFDTDEIRDVMQHINNICETQYICLLKEWPVRKKVSGSLIQYYLVKI